MGKTIDRIKFHYLNTAFYFPNRTQLKSFLLRLFKKEEKEVEAINYIFCDDEYLLQINKQYLNHDTLTDIITFELSPKGIALTSDIYISIDRVRENAKLYQTSFTNEVHRVIFHGALHLCGYKDKSKEQTQVMRQKEEENLMKYLVPRGTNTRNKD